MRVMDNSSIGEEGRKEGRKEGSRGVNSIQEWSS